MHLLSIIVALAVVFVPWQCRLMCTQAALLKEQSFVVAGRSEGAGHWRTMFRHIYPNALAPCIVQMVWAIGAIILVESGLAFLGLTAGESWGYIADSWSTLVPLHFYVLYIMGAAWLVLVMGFYLMGDGLRAVFGPSRDTRGQDRAASD